MPTELTVYIDPPNTAQFEEPPKTAEGTHFFRSPDTGYLYFVTSAEFGPTPDAFGIFIVKSTDGGVTWTKVVDYVPGGGGRLVCIAQVDNSTFGHKIFILYVVNGATEAILVPLAFTMDSDYFDPNFQFNPLLPYPQQFSPSNLMVGIDDENLLIVYQSGSNIGSGYRISMVTMDIFGDWGSPIALPEMPNLSGVAFSYILSDTANIYLIAQYRNTGGKIYGLIIDKATLTAGAWTTLYDDTDLFSHTLLNKVGYCAIVNNKLIIPYTLKPEAGYTFPSVMRMMCMDLDFSNLNDTVVVSDSDLTAPESLNLFSDIFPWPNAFALNIAGTLYLFYITALPWSLSTPAQDQGYIYYKTATPCGALSAPTLLYTTPLGRDIITPFALTPDNANFIVLAGMVDPVLFWGLGSKRQSIFLDVITPIRGLEVTCNNPPAGTVGVAYSHQIGIFSDNPIVLVTASGLPPGLSIDNTGLITGTPTAAGTFTPTITVHDDQGRISAITCTIVIACPSGPAPSELAIACLSPPSGSVGTSYSHALGISGGSAPYVVTLASGNLPPNLTLSMAGLISGIPVSNGTFAFVVRVTDSDSDTATVSCSITIGNCDDDAGGPG